MTFDSRERKKSKYLSYPYVNLGIGRTVIPTKTEDSETLSSSTKVEGSSVAPNCFNGTTSTAKSGTKTSRRNWRRKSIRCSTMFHSPEFINASAADLLYGLYSKAIGCNFPKEDRQSDFVECFFLAYRSSTYRDEAELATSLINLKGGNSGTPIKNSSLDINSEEQKRKKKKLEHTLQPGTKSISSQEDTNMSMATNEFLSACSSEINTARPGGDVEEVNTSLQMQNVGTTLKGSVAACSSVPEGPRLSSLACEGTAKPRKRKKRMAAMENPSSKTLLNLPDVDEKDNKCSSLVIDLQMLLPPSNGIPDKTNAEKNEEPDLLGSNPELNASQTNTVGNVASHSLLVSTTSAVNDASMNKALKRRRKSKERGPVEHLMPKIATVVPDLNGSSTEYNPPRKELENENRFSLEVKYMHNQDLNPEEELAKSTFVGTGFAQTNNHNKMEVNGDADGTCLLLQFDPAVSVPSKDDLMATFCRFGPLKVTETQSLKDGRAQIVFIRSADAGEAFRSIQQNKPFGGALIDCKLHRHSVIIPPVEKCIVSTEPCSKPLHCERPSLDFMRQNLQMMASTLEKSGSNVSPQIRDRLEGEITNLLKKVNSMTSSCSGKI